MRVSFLNECCPCIAIFILSPVAPACFIFKPPARNDKPRFFTCATVTPPDQFKFTVIPFMDATRILPFHLQVPANPPASHAGKWQILHSNSRLPSHLLNTPLNRFTATPKPAKLEPCLRLDELPSAVTRNTNKCHMNVRFNP